MQRSFLEAWLALRQPGGPRREQTAAAWDACQQHLAPEAAASVPPAWRRRWEEMAATLVLLEQQQAGPAQLPGGGDLMAHAGGHELEPSLTARAMDGWQLEVVAENLPSQEIEIQVFPMDAEILFSTSPFAVVDRGITGYHGSGSLGKFSFVAPSKVLRIATPPTSGPVLVDISSHLPPLEESAAVLVQLMAGDCTCSLPVYAAGLRARAAPREGVLYVREQEGQEWAAAATAYCKVYCKDFHGAERFYKDGYTDLLGRFDYASLSGPPGSTGIMEMAALVVSKHGCVIMRIDPPPGLS
mmetsp:Transcript_26088/g.73070  ORF Transcript_26088/g.73070 Transcript_26088/m.73070 type:complete len:299 (-) Transcript_26088:372-1268(-)